LQILGSYDTVINDVIDNEILPINFAHTVMQNKLPFHHRDPFDRIIVSQAIVEKLNNQLKNASTASYHNG
jgi:PIN domain nuclease of toxin-antitoxin system